METEEGPQVVIGLGAEIVMKLHENGVRERKQPMSENGWRWPTTQGKLLWPPKRPYSPDSECPDKTRPAPGAPRNARRSWSSNEDEGKDYDKFRGVLGYSYSNNIFSIANMCF